MNVYIISECEYEGSEIIKVFETEQMARDYVHKRYHIVEYDESDPYIENLVVYYMTKEPERDVLIQRFGVQHEKI